MPKSNLIDSLRAERMAAEENMFAREARNENRRDRDRAKRLATALFTDGSGVRCDRLVMKLGNDYRGGWGERPMANFILAMMRRWRKT